MTENEAQEMVEHLLRNDMRIATAVAELRREGVSWAEIARRASVAAAKISREVP